MKVGVLALQGDVPEHREALERVLPSRDVVAVRAPDELEAVDALVLPGGESTTIADLMSQTGLWTVLQRRLGESFPVLGTCAGLILLSSSLEPSPRGRDPPTLGALDVVVRRNDYGSQRESFEGPVALSGVPGASFPGVFIRAPRILRVGKSTTPIAWHHDEIVGVRRGAVVGLSFHPELSPDPRVHAWFLREVVAKAQGRGSHSRKTTTARTERTRPTSAQAP